MRVNKKEAEWVWTVTKQLYFDTYSYDKFVMNFNHRPDQFNFDEFKTHFSLT